MLPYSRIALILILVLALLCAALLLNGHLVPAGDNATYIVLGQALASGKGYRMISDPRLPEMGLYPPGYPLLLAGILALTGTTQALPLAILPMKVVSVLLHAAAAALAYGLFRRRNPVLAALTGLLVAVNPNILHFATEVGTEIPYLLLTLGSLSLFECYYRKPRVRLLFLLAALLVIAFYVRSIALVMVMAFALHMALGNQHRWKHALLLVLVVVVLAAPWFIYTARLPGTGTSVGLGRGYFALYFSSDPYGTAKASLSEWVARVAQNVSIYVLQIWPDALFPHATRVAQALGPLGSPFAAIISLLVLLGFALELRRKSPAEWYVALFFASCVGYLWAQSRLIVPIIPFAFYYMLSAVDWLLKRVSFGQRHPAAARSAATQALRPSSSPGSRVQGFALAATGAVLLLSALMVEVRAVQRNVCFGWGHSVAEYYAQDPEWDNYLKAMQWIARDAPDPAVVICRKADLMYVLTGHAALEYPYTVDGKELRQFANDNHVTYLIEDAFSWTRTTQEYLRPALQSWRDTQPEALSLEYETSTPRTRVWRLNKLQ